MSTERFESQGIGKQEDSVPEDAGTAESVRETVDKVRGEVCPLFDTSSSNSDRSWDAIEYPDPPGDCPSRSDCSPDSSGDLFWMDG